MQKPSLRSSLATGAARVVRRETFDNKEGGRRREAVSREYFCIGPSPYKEDCAQVGQPDYHRKAIAECSRFVQLIRDTLGSEPEGAELGIKAFEHDFGTYHEVVCWFEADNPTAVAYAQRCEDEAPATWDG